MGGCLNLMLWECRQAPMKTQRNIGKQRAQQKASTAHQYRTTPPRRALIEEQNCVVLFADFATNIVLRCVMLGYCVGRPISLNPDYEDYEKKRVQEGLCVLCGAPRGAERAALRTCKECCLRSTALARERRASRREENRRNLVCPRCGGAPAGKAAYCEAHLLAKMGEGLAPGLDLRGIFDAQGARCFYTDRALTLGVNASLDHKKPRSRFPELASTPSNLAFCDISINLLKGKRTDEEFIQICREVAAQHPKPAT